MKKSAAQQWLSARTASQNRLLIMAVAAMCGLGLASWAFELLIMWGILRIAFFSSGVLCVLVSLMIQGTVQFFTWLRMPSALPEPQRNFVIDGETRQFSTVPALGQVWVYALGSLETDRTWIERLLGILSLPQRMMNGAWYLWNRMQSLKTMDIPACASVIHLLYRKAERVEAGEIVEALSLEVPARILREVSFIEGVVFLPRGHTGLTLTPRLTDELNAFGRPSPDDD